MNESSEGIGRHHTKKPKGEQYDDITIIVESIVAPISQEARTYSACAAPGEIVFEWFPAKLILGGVK